MPAAFDPAKLIVRITRAFARFPKRPIEERRDLLRAVFREIVLDNARLSAMTLNRGFLDGANLSSPSSTPVCKTPLIERRPAAMQSKPVAAGL